MNPLISAIVAISENRVMGHNNKLPWHLPADLRHFKALTTDHTIIMGRKTFNSIGKALPHRTNIIITHNPCFEAPGCMIANSLENALEQAKLCEDHEIFIIGGAEIFKQSMNFISRIYLTVIHHLFDGDVFFPELNHNEWTKTSTTDHEPDEENNYAFSFIIFERLT